MGNVGVLLVGHADHLIHIIERHAQAGVTQAFGFQAAFDEFGVDQLADERGGHHLDFCAGQLFLYFGGDLLGGAVVKLGLSDESLFNAGAVPGIHFLGAGPNKQRHVSGFGVHEHGAFGIH